MDLTVGKRSPYFVRPRDSSIEPPVIINNNSYTNSHNILSKINEIKNSEDPQKKYSQIENLKQKRSAANDRERRRMNSLNKAYDDLRRIIPSMGRKRAFSKFETLQMAQMYIQELMELLEKYSSKEESYRIDPCSTTNQENIWHSEKTNSFLKEVF